jgi:mannose-6-phosphate isomerase-like protein (cupin superfamily)
MQSTSHSIGQKFVFFRNDEFQSPLTQIAIGTLNSEETVPFHLHESMEEVFYILKGNGTFYIGDEKIDVEKNSCIKIPLNKSP